MKSRTLDCSSEKHNEKRLSPRCKWYSLNIARIGAMSLALLLGPMELKPGNS